MQKPNKPLTPSGLPAIHFIGPSLDLGPLPSIFYFSLSAEESLTLDPFNQPAVRLAELGIRVFSITLPAHEGSFPHSHAMKAWADDIGSEGGMIEHFISMCKECLSYLIDSRLADPSKIGVAGLSRGAFIAFLLAAHDERISAVLGFSPLTRIGALEESEKTLGTSSNPNAMLENFTDRLAGKTVRIYIGNVDTRVSTSSCFSFVKKLAESSYAHKHRPPPVEMIIFPSIGHKGHGTPQHIFVSGANWLADIL